MSDNEKCEISRGDLEQMVEFYHSLSAADAIFKPCQNQSFRQHAHSCLQAINVEAAFRRAAALIGKEV